MPSSVAQARIPQVSTDGTLRRLSIEFEVGAEPITGRVTDAAGASLSFCGWLQLIDGLERARNPETVPADGQGDHGSALGSFTDAEGAVEQTAQDRRGRGVAAGDSIAVAATNRGHKKRRSQDNTS
jgi:hypothetical protein